jgi:GTP cyclohydrolase II
MDAKVIELLREKIQVIKNGDEAIYMTGPIKLPVTLDEQVVEFSWYCWLSESDGCQNNPTAIIDKMAQMDLAQLQQSSVLVYGDFKESEESLIRFHSICHTGDIFHSRRCDCGYQLNESLKKIVEHGSGALFYLANHEGRGIGLFSKAMAYVLQENGYDTVEANEALGFKDDSRDYSEATSVLSALRQKPVTVITNNPKKLAALRASGMNLTGRIAMWGGETEQNEKYLSAKVDRSGHIK